MSRTLATIDVGTNSFHLFIVRLEGRDGLKFRVLEHVREVVRLGAGSSDMKSLSPAASRRAIDTLGRFKKIADSQGAEIRAVGTSAVREALNQNQFIARVKKETGITINAVSGFEEARLIYLGVLQRLQVFNRKVLLLHIGGGSAEVMIGLRREILYDNCIKLGAIRLTDRFFPDGKFRASSVSKCRDYVRGMLGPLERAVDSRGFETAIGSSGTILAIARMAVAGNGGPNNGNRINGIVLSRKKILAFIEKIVSSPSVKDLSRLPAIDAQRADILVAGAIILEQMLLRFRIKELLLSEGSLKEGIVLDYLEKMNRARTHRHLNDLRRRSVENLARIFNVETAHARHVAFLATRLFDETRRLRPEPLQLRYSDGHRELLEYASILHDVGFFLSHAQHHRHSYYLIRNAELLGFTEHEKALMANIARYHRKSHPRLKHEGFSELDSEGRETVLRLAALLRIADGLDRSHTGLVRDLHCALRPQEVVCSVSPRPDIDVSLEIWGAERKKELFELVYGKKLVLRIKRS